MPDTYSYYHVNHYFFLSISVDGESVIRENHLHFP